MTEQSENISLHNPEQEKGNYNPLVPLRRDFDADWIYVEKGKAVIDSSDLLSVMHFYREALVEGTTLNLGAGTTHFHYMLASEDKLTHLTALDISPQNLQVLEEFKSGFEGHFEKGRQHIARKDVRLLQIIAKAAAQDLNYGGDHSGDQILKDIFTKSTNPDGSLDVILGDMHKLEVLGDRKFDNVVLCFSIFVSKDVSELTDLFQGIKSHLNENGKVIIADIQGFTEKDLDEVFPEAPEVRANFIAPYLDSEILSESLNKAGFSDVSVKARPVEDEGVEKERGFIYLFAQASNITS